MAGGLAALLDDVALIAKAASAASTKAAGVVIDDTAVTPQYVQGITPARELPMIAKISRGSLRNKAILIVLLLLLDAFLPWVLTPLLMLGGTYLSFEGAEKLWEALTGGHHGEHEVDAAVERGDEYEKQMVRGAVTTDFILSAEIMVISLAALNDGGAMPLWEKALALVITAIVMTVGVYGFVALLVKMDDVGLAMTKRGTAGGRRIGNLLVEGMPKVLDVISTVGIAAMLWVGGHILLVGLDELGWHAPYALTHHLSELGHHVPGVGGVLAWLIGTLCAALFGLVVGGILVAVAHVLPLHGRGRHDEVPEPEPHERHVDDDAGDE